MKLLIRSKLFWLGLALKLVCLPLFGSHYLRGLFIPFLDAAVRSSAVNPWAAFPGINFPYGSVLFLILWLPRWLAHSFVGEAALGQTPVSLALVKGPMLVLDVLLLWGLVRFAPRRRDRIIFFYWLNPILFFITYVQGQLDVAATAFCVLAIFYLSTDKIRKSAFFFSAATLCKFHVTAVVPFLMAYIWNRSFARESFRKMGTWMSIWLGVSAIGFLPLILANRFLYASMSSPEAFRIFALNFNFGHGQVFYAGFFIFIGLLARLCLSDRITQQGLIFGSAAIFGTLVLVTNAMPGWYYWIVPWAALFFAVYDNAPPILLGCLIAAYLFHFVLLDALGLSNSSFYWGIGFTTLQASLAGVLLMMFRLCLVREADVRRRAKPLLCGIAGNSGAGKNHLAYSLSKLFNERNSITIEGDDYHKWERGNKNWEELTHLNPRANNLLTMADHALHLVHGKAVLNPHYDHTSGQFTATREIKPGRFIIIQGLHALYLKGMRDFLDLKVFVAPHDTVRTYWKIRRDVQERGYTVSQVLQNISFREEDSKAHINPQREFADWVIEYHPTTEVSVEKIDPGSPLSVWVRHILWNDAPVLELFEMLAESLNCRVSFNLLPQDISRIAVDVTGMPTAEEIGSLGRRLFPSLRQIIRSRQEPTWLGGYDGINQLVALALLGQKSWRNERAAVY